MFVLKAENANDEIITLTGNESNYVVESITGLNPPDAEIYTSNMAGFDGSRYKYSKLNERNIVITLRLQGDIAGNRVMLYRYFKTKKYVKIFFKNELRDVYIEGYVEKIACDQFTKTEKMQISIVCPNPYWKSVSITDIDISLVYDNFEFAFSNGAKGATVGTADDSTDDAIEFTKDVDSRDVVIYNDSETETGLKITLTALNDNINDIIIYSVYTGQFMKLNTTLNKDDVLIINTERGNKSIMKNNTENLIDALSYDSSWLQMEIGKNIFTYSSSNSRELQVIITTRQLFEGV